jgi:GTPase SAR1 family protein
LLVGNKLDLEEYREISKEQLEKFKEENYISESIEFSLETRENVENMFRKFIEMLLEN